MKFTVPCFVHVEDAEKRKELIKWLFNIGYGCQDGVDPNYPIVLCSLTGDNVDVMYEHITYSLVGLKFHDCGSNIEMFKALAAINAESDWEQWFTGELNGEKLWWKCDALGKRDRYLKGKLLHKATVEEIVERFKIQLL